MIEPIKHIKDIKITGLLSQLPASLFGQAGWPWIEETSLNIYKNRSDWPRVSIVTPSFNQAAFIEETIRSILLQNYPNLQYIVIDGGSTDGTIDILEKYAPWLDYWVSEADRGQSHAINKGLERCDGQWFNWINSDDYLKPAALFRLVEASASKSHTQIVAGVTENIQNGVAFGYYSTTLQTHATVPFFALGVNQPGSLLHLDDVRACGGLQEDLSLCMDLDLWLRLLLCRGQIGFQAIPNIVAAYRYHAASKTCSTEDVFALEEFALLIDLYIALTNLVLPQSLRELRRQSPVEPRAYQSYQTIDPNIAKRAFFDRLVVTDTLLFRAILRVPNLQKMPFRFWKQALNDLRPMLKQIYGEDTRTIEATAWLRAMQNRGRVNIRGVLAVLNTLPLCPSVRELIRITIRG